jgi:hypothetical protein
MVAVFHRFKQIWSQYGANPGTLMIKALEHNPAPIPAWMLKCVATVAPFDDRIRRNGWS